MYSLGNDPQEHTAQPPFIERGPQVLWILRKRGNYFQLPRTGVVTRCRTPHTLDVRLAGNPPEEELHSRKVPQRQT